MMSFIPPKGSLPGEEIDEEKSLQHKQKGNVLFKQKNYDEAIQNYTKAGAVATVAEASPKAANQNHARASTGANPPPVPSAKAAGDNYRPAHDVSFVSDTAMDLGFGSLMVPPETHAVFAVFGAPLLVKKRAGVQKNRM